MKRRITLFIDVEVSGLDHTKHALLSLAAVPTGLLDSTVLFTASGIEEIRRLSFSVRIRHNEFLATPAALKMNEYLTWPESGKVALQSAQCNFAAWLCRTFNLTTLGGLEIVIGGWHPHFDADWFRDLLNSYTPLSQIELSYKYLDAYSAVYATTGKDSESLSKAVKKFLPTELERTLKSHHALDDAIAAYLLFESVTRGYVSE